YRSRARSIPLSSPNPRHPPARAAPARGALPGVQDESRKPALAVICIGRKRRRLQLDAVARRVAGEAARDAGQGTALLERRSCRRERATHSVQIGHHDAEVAPGGAILGRAARLLAHVQLGATEVEPCTRPAGTFGARDLAQAQHASVKRTRLSVVLDLD